MSTDVPSGAFRIGPYEALERLGRGGFASVYKARDLRTGQLVALKVVPSGTDPESVRRLMREARAVARVAHPNVVRVYECGVTAEGAYVAMELLVGRTLQDLIDEEGALPVPRALDIAAQLLEGLAAAHDHKIVHRDVKPGNIFITQDAHGVEVPHLLDFGVSKFGAGNVTQSSHQDRTLPGTAMGTPGFMAPEQYGSAYAADARADVYGVAATLYTMLTGRLPFDAGTYESWVVKVKGERAPSVAAVAPHIPADLAMAIDRALARDPDARWSTAREFCRALVGEGPAEFGSTTRRDQSPGSTAPGKDRIDRTAPLIHRASLGLPEPVSSAASTPRTEPPPPTEPRPAVNAAVPSAAPVAASGPAASSGTGAGSGARKIDEKVLSSTRRSGEPSAEPSRPRANRRASGGLWFVSGALVGALLAAVGAGIALWARSRVGPPPPPPSVDAEAPR
ncbi:MAG: serine/threonine-protein kinase [Polyangiaceae bacterium]